MYKGDPVVMTPSACGGLRVAYPVDITFKCPLALLAWHELDRGAGFGNGELIHSSLLQLLWEEGSKLKSELERLIMGPRDGRIFLNGGISFTCFSTLMPEPLLTNFLSF